MKSRVIIFVLAIFAAPAFGQMEPAFQTWLNQLGYSDPNRPVGDFGITDPFCLNATAVYIERAGYPVEIHKVQTPDGYILKLFRIPFSPRSPKTGIRIPVLVVHTILGSSDDFVELGPDQGLGFNLADAGFDVWLVNVRGNTYSRENVCLPPTSPQFWQFSWHEIGVYDLPEVIDYILWETEQVQLHYVGHGQGSTVFFVLASERPPYMDKIITAQLMSPTAYVRSSEMPFFKLLASMATYWEPMKELGGEGQFNPSLTWTESFRKICQTRPFCNTRMCRNLYFLVLGYESPQIDYYKVPDLLRCRPAGASTMQVLHYMQLVQSRQFRQFDFGQMTNLQRYGSKTPPYYDLEQVTPPTALWYGGNDWFATEMDVRILIAYLPNLAGRFLIKYRTTDIIDAFDNKWTHVDFVFSSQAPTLVYRRIANLMNAYTEMTYFY